MVVPVKPQMKTWRMLISRWVPKATDTHSENVILVFPLLRVQWLQEHAWALHLYVHCMSCYVDTSKSVHTAPYTLIVVNKKWDYQKKLWNGAHQEEEEDEVDLTLPWRKGLEE